MNWLDTETKAILQKTPEPKLAPPKAGEFALVLLQQGMDTERLVEVIREINGDSEIESRRLVFLPVPVVINSGLTEGEALWGQFELICCDAIAAFFRSEVLRNQDAIYLHDLYQQIMASTEFEPARISVSEIPQTEAGEQFIEQFVARRLVGQTKAVSSISTTVPFKKARIMAHWAARLGARMQYDSIYASGSDKET